MAISTSIKNFATPHKTNGGGGGGNTYVTNAGNHLIVGSTNAYDTTATNGLIYNIRGDKLDYNEGKFVDLTATNGNITNLTGYTLNFNDGSIDNLLSDIVLANNIGTEQNPINELYAHKANIDQILSTNITTDYLTVTKSAHFFELIIDKIKSVGGSIILSATNCTLDYAEATNITVDNVTYNAYEVWWKAKGPDGRETSNDWWKYDQAICQSFNNVTQGVNNNVDSKYYWRLVMDVPTSNETPYYMWLGREDDPRNGTKIQSQNEILKNTLYINNVYTINSAPSAPSDNHWLVTAHGGEWNPATTPDQSTPSTLIAKGMFKSSSPYDYLELEAIYDSEVIVPNVLNIQLYHQSITCFARQARLNVMIEYADGTSQCQPASDISNLSSTDVNIGSTYNIYISLNTDIAIKKVYIFNADNILWQKVHHITLGNDNRNGQGYTYPQYDANSSYGYSSVPAPGDSLVHLGYRWFAAGDIDHAWRASAIMISAYQTPDSDLTPPSYAHYKDITSFNLRTKRHTYFDATKAHFVGDFYVDANNTIQMNVYDTINNRTGINIDQGTITLDAANTYVNGNLTLTSNDQGFTVKGPNGMTVMTPESLGTYSSFIAANNITETIDALSYSIATLNANTNRYDTSFTYDYCIGYKPAGSNITITNQSLTYQYGRIDGTMATVTTSYGNSVAYQAYLDDGTGHISSTIADTGAIYGAGSSVANVGTLSIATGGRIWIRATWSPSFASSSLTNYDGLGIRTNLIYTVSYPMDGVYTKIASDGIGINMNGSKYVYMGNDGVYIDYGSKGGLHINGNKMEKRDPNGMVDNNGNPLWVTMSTMGVHRLGGRMTSYSVLDTDEVIVIDDSENASGYTCMITLPLPIERSVSSTSGWKGRILYFKNYSNATIKVQCNSGGYGYIIPSDKNSSNATAEQTLGNYAKAYICDGIYWNELHFSG